MDDIRVQAVTEFVAIAEQYCSLLEQASKMRTGDLFNALQQLLPEIYLKASRLPKPKYCYEEEPKKFVREDDYAMIHDALQQKIELVNGIARMSPGTQPNRHELISFSLAELLADSYEELKNFTRLYEVAVPQAMNDAVWLCRQSYEQSFGLKLMDSMKLLHTVIYSKDTEGSRAVKRDDFTGTFEEDEDEPWYSDEQEEVYGDDE